MDVQAAQHWELALGVNPLHPEGWFSLGYCALKQQDFARALQAFSRCAQQQPDNGDAWNNLAAIHLQVQRCLPQTYHLLTSASKSSSSMSRVLKPCVMSNCSTLQKRRLQLTVPL